MLASCLRWCESQRKRLTPKKTLPVIPQSQSLTGAGRDAEGRLSALFRCDHMAGACRSLAASSAHSKKALSQTSLALWEESSPAHTSACPQNSQWSQSIGAVSYNVREGAHMEQRRLSRSPALGISAPFQQHPIRNDFQRTTVGPWQCTRAMGLL